MNYKELLARYREGQVTEEEKQLVDLEIEKYEAIGDYLGDIMDNEFKDIVEVAKNEKSAEETIKLKRSVNNRLRKVVFKSVALAMALFIGIFFAISPLIDTLYYNPAKTTVGESENDISFDIYAISELNMPGLSPSNVFVDKQGFGEYDVRYSYRNVFTDEFYSVSHKIKRGKIEASTREPILSPNMFLDIKHPDVSNIYTAERKQKVINHLNELNPVSYVSVGIRFEKDLSMEELYELELQYPDIEFQWAGIRTSPLDRQIIGIQLINSKSSSSLLGDKNINDKYEAFFILDWLTNPMLKKDNASLSVAQAYEKHYTSLLKYMLDREEAISVLEYRTEKKDLYQAALEYAEDQGIKTYGVLVFAEVRDLLEMITEKDIKGLDFNQALVSRKYIN